jgi:glycerol uptake facilitator-like aquaporin
MATAAAAPSVRRDTDDKADDAMRSSLSSTAALRPHHKKDPGQYSPYQLDGHPAAAAATNRSLAAAATTIGTAKDGATAHEILAAEERRQRKKQEQAEMDHGAGHHKWADHVPLPYWLVVPKELRQKVAAEDLESQEQQGDSSGPNGRDHELVLRQARVNFLRRLLAEMVGACVLAGVHSFLRVRDWQGELSGGDVGVFGGLTLVILVYSIGEISGAHFNPVITMAFTMRRIFPAVWLLPYWAAQIVGAICAGGIIRGFFGPLAGKGTSYVETETSRFTPVSGMMFEVCITFMLAFTALSVCTRGSIVGVHAALAVGAVVGMNIGLGSGITGGCMNPARVLGPAIINGPWDTIWAVIIGPFIGGLIAVIIHAALSGRPPHVAKKPAMGDGKECEA